MVTHDLDLLDGFDRVLVVDGGRVVEDGAPGGVGGRLPHADGATGDAGAVRAAGQPVHRTPAGLKLLALAGLSVLLFAVPDAAGRRRRRWPRVRRPGAGRGPAARRGARSRQAAAGAGGGWSRCSSCTSLVTDLAHRRG